jgi:predicted MPP superfamily phosphohydrolase
MDGHQADAAEQAARRTTGRRPARRPLRVAFLSDLHTGSHSDDVVRLNAIIDQVASLAPDLVLYGGDYVNM